MKTKRMFYLPLIIFCSLCLFALPQAMAEVNARFDASKMGDMYNFDPNNPVIPTGDTIKIAEVVSFSGPAAVVGQIYWISALWAAHDINQRGGILVDGKAFWRIPKKMRKTLTVDNGKEFARFKKLEDKTGLTVYFADPYSAWQRGTNENTNGLLRQYFPKGTDFRNVSEEDLAFAVKKLNHRPRKCLNYQSPHEVFWKAKNGALAT